MILIQMVKLVEKILNMAIILNIYEKAMKFRCMILKKFNQPIKMASDKFMNLVFGSGVKVLELVKGRELDDIEAVGCDDLGLPLE